jgi:hypothetical protein
MQDFYASNDDSDEDSNETDNDTVSDRDSNGDSFSEASDVSDNIVSSDSEDGAGHHVFRNASEHGDSDFSEASSSSEDREDDARSSCYDDSGSEDREDTTFL